MFFPIMTREVSPRTKQLLFGDPSVNSNFKPLSDPQTAPSANGRDSYGRGEVPATADAGTFDSDVAKRSFGRELGNR